ncbi:MAG: hypothetical protein KME54_15390 [Tolypothrix brevis GSE-NOS-MK-07-07A]|jgi:photosystem II stability/assembly factor-like uncharacterized protein|nr:hypothetical protein [Tolypothrix brevis GSE-NOS-MK-07-07A]
MSSDNQVKTREDLLYLLSQAAELEHSLACQYLFTAFSLKESTDEGVSQAQLTKINKWRRKINEIAVQEMLHLALASNLLTAIGGAPYFRRANFPQAKTYTSLKLQFKLAPFNETTLNRYICFELPNNFDIASSRTDDIWFIDPMVGWAVNSNGHIIKTTDGGNTWEKQFQTPIVNGRPIYLRCVGFSTPLNGWVGTVSEEQRLYHTTDGGKTWAVVENLPEKAPVKVCGLSVVNESVVYASGTNDPADIPARMMKTLDGGVTWIAWDMSEYATILIDNYFINENCGWVVGGKADKSITNPSRDDVIPVVLYTEDGGKAWVNRVANISSFPLGEWGWKIQFLNEKVGFVSLENFNQGAILKTTDGGKTWTRLRINDDQENVNLEGVGFVDENLGWVGIPNLGLAIL